MDNIVNLNYETLIEKKEKIIISYLDSVTDDDISFLVGNFVVEFIENSLKIEGYSVSENDIRFILNNNKPENEVDYIAIRRIKNLWNSYEYIINKSSRINPHLDQELKLLNSYLLDKINLNGGLFNVDTKNIEVQEKYDRVMKMENKLIEIVREYRHSYDSIYKRLARFYLKFINLNPFIEDNKLTGILFLNLELFKNNKIPIIIIKEDLKELEKAEDEYNKSKKVDRMERFITKNISKKIDKLIEELKILSLKNRNPN